MHSRGVKRKTHKIYINARRRLQNCTYVNEAGSNILMVGGGALLRSGALAGVNSSVLFYFFARFRIFSFFFDHSCWCDIWQWEGVSGVHRFHLDKV